MEVERGKLCQRAAHPPSVSLVVVVEEADLRSQHQMEPSPGRVGVGPLSQQICLHQPVEEEHEILVAVLMEGMETVAESLLYVIEAAMTADHPPVFATAAGLEEDPFDLMMSHQYAVD